VVHQLLLDDLLDASRVEMAREVAATVRQIASVAATLSELIADGPLAGDLGAVVDARTHGDARKALDALAHARFVEAMRAAPVAVLGSEESEEAVMLRPDAPLAVAIDPLDGSSNIDANVSIGTIFSVWPMSGVGNGTPAAALLRPGRHQLAAGFVIYGPQTSLVLTLGRGTDVLTLDRGRFVLTQRQVKIPAGAREYAINASNHRHWDEATRLYVDDLVAGVDGPRGRDFNMRWIASLVAEAFRILSRAGIFLYPADRRPGYGEGRLRLVYEALPLAMIIEQAGGAAIDGFTPILDLVPRHLHQRTPLIFGSADKVQRVSRYYLGPPSTSERSPLFARRGLFHP
jgi:fructose-1,6-bisphosphatase I